jgi:hypothetical protein
MKGFSMLHRLAIMGLVIFILAGCSQDNPLESSSTTALRNLPVLEDTNPEQPVSEAGQYQFSARVQTIDCNRLMLTFYGYPDTVIASQNCQIVRYNNDNETPIPFTEIHGNDSAAVYGCQNQNGDIIATRLRLYDGEDCPFYDFAFRDTITAIDYAALTFTVAGRTETITVDSNTFIWTGVAGLFQSQGVGLKTGGRFDSVLVFADLQVGDVVEVKANTVDEATLYAVKIKVANANYTACVNFEDVLASITMPKRLVTFNQLAWIGKVCQNASLIGADGEVITLQDFAVGDLVAVTGRADGDTLRISEMIILPQ